MLHPLSCARNAIRHIKRITLRLHEETIAKSSSYSSITALLAGLFAVTLMVDLLEGSQEQFSQGALFLLLLACVGFGFFAVLRGTHLKRFVGLAMVALHALSSALILAFTTESLQAVAVLQQMPLIALYLAWFFPARRARWVMFVYVWLVVGGIAVGDEWARGGTHIWTEWLRLGLHQFLAMELGFLWRRRIDRESQLDSLTGVFTRAGLQSHGKRELSRATRHHTPLTYVIIDLDRFKEVNDTAGHSAGDRVLAKVAQELRTNLRGSDLVFRVGGDEFVLLLPETNYEQTLSLMERLRALSFHPWSWGAAEMQPSDTMSTLGTRADKAMYLDKKRRRGSSENRE